MTTIEHTRCTPCIASTVSHVLGLAASKREEIMDTMARFGGILTTLDQAMVFVQQIPRAILARELAHPVQLA